MKDEFVDDLRPLDLPFEISLESITLLKTCLGSWLFIKFGIIQNSTKSKIYDHIWLVRRESARTKRVEAFY